MSRGVDVRGRLGQNGRGGVPAGSGAPRGWGCASPPKAARLICWLVALCAWVGCNKASSSAPGAGSETLVIRYEGSPGNVSIAELAEDLGYLAPVRLEFVGNNMTGGPHSIQAVLTGDLDVGGSFNGSIV